VWGWAFKNQLWGWVTANHRNCVSEYFPGIGTETTAEVEFVGKSCWSNYAVSKWLVVFRLLKIL